MNFIDGTERQQRLYLETRFDLLKRYGFLWGLGLSPNLGRPLGYASSGDCLQKLNVAQASNASSDGSKPIVSIYTNCMERGEGDVYAALTQKLNDHESPASALNTTRSWFLLDSSGKRVQTYPNAWGVNLTSAAPADSRGRRYAEFCADWYVDNIFGHTDADGSGVGDYAGIGVALDNLFGAPGPMGNKSAHANWLLNFDNQGTDQASNDKKLYNWPGGVRDTIAGQFRKGMAAFIAQVRKRFPPGQAPGIWPNVEIVSTDLSEPEYKGLVEGGMLESPFNGPWTGPDDKRAFWSYEYLHGASVPGDWSGYSQAGSAGKPTRGFKDGTSFWLTFARARTIQSNTRDGRFVVNVFGCEQGPDWWKTPNNLANWRYVFGICHLADKWYPSISPGGPGGIGTRYGPQWFDELDQPIGQPVGPVPSAAWSNGVAMREYQNALVLVNTTTQVASVDPSSVSHGKWKFFAGAQDPKRNSGGDVSGSISIGGKDGVLLLKR